jgi:hypothetical protein
VSFVNRSSISPSMHGAHDCLERLAHVFALSLTGMGERFYLAGLEINLDTLISTA